MSTMTEIMNGALELPRTDRSYLASKLSESMDEEDGLGEEWLTELDRRVERWKSGESPSVSREELHRKIKSRLAL